MSMSDVNFGLLSADKKKITRHFQLMLEKLFYSIWDRCDPSTLAENGASRYVMTRLSVPPVPFLT